MNRGFKEYLKLGKKETKKIFKQKGNFFRYYLYQLMNLLSYALVFLRPVFNVSNVRMARVAAKNNVIGVFENFDKMNEPKNYWNSLLTSLIYILLLLSGILMIVLIGGIIYGVLYTIVSFDSVPSSSVMDTITIVSLLPVIILSLAYIIMLSIYFSPNYYLLDSVDGINITKTYRKSYVTMKQKVKGTYFMINFIPNLLLVLLLGVPVLLTGLNMTFILRMIIVLIGAFFALFFGCRLMLRKNIAVVKFFEDIIIDKPNIVKTIDSKIIRHFDGEKPNIDSLKDNLVALFDDTEECSYSTDNVFTELVDDDEKPLPDDETKEETNEEVKDEAVTEESNEEVKEENESTNDNEGLTKEEVDFLKDNPDLLKK